jgi:hypothetical protein
MEPEIVLKAAHPTSHPMSTDRDCGGAPSVAWR